MAQGARHPRRRVFGDGVGGAVLSAESGQINHASGTHYFRGLDVKEFPEETATGMMDSLLYAPCDYVITQSYTCMSREEARKALKRTAVC